MKDHGLDLAVIGNGRTAALIDPTSRIVWWCFPHFDGDPVFCRLLSGNEEKGFSDVVLDDMVDFQSEYLRNTAIVSTVLTDRRGGAVAPAPRVLAPVGGPARPPEEGAVVQGVVHPARPIRMKLFHWSHEEVTPSKALRCLRSRN